MSWLTNNRATVIAGIVVCMALVAACVAFGPFQQSTNNARVAVVHDSEGNEHRLPLDQPTTLEVVTDLGRNVVVVEQGAVHISEADCPKGSCMHQRPISQPGEQLVCLPHRLWVEVLGDDGTSELDTTAVTWDDETDLVSQ